PPTRSHSRRLMPPLGNWSSKENMETHLRHLPGPYCSNPRFFCDANTVGSLLPFVDRTGDVPLLGITRIGTASQDLDRAFHFALPVREIIATKTTEVQRIGAKNDRKPDNRTSANSVTGFTNNGDLAPS